MPDPICPKCHWGEIEQREPVAFSNGCTLLMISEYRCKACRYEWDPPRFTIRRASRIAKAAHAGQTDLLGAPYELHLAAVADGLKGFPLPVQIAGWLHDILEDTVVTSTDLHDAGVPPRAIAAIEAVTRREGQPYDQMIRDLAAGPEDAIYVKIADNAHNSRPDRVDTLLRKTGKPLNPRYTKARKVLYPAADPTKVAKILERVNPSLLDELDDLVPGEHGARARAFAAERALGVRTPDGVFEFKCSACRRIAASFSLQLEASTVDLGQGPDPEGNHLLYRDNGPSYLYNFLFSGAGPAPREVIDLLQGALTVAPVALHAIDSDWGTFHCRGCQKNYCSDHWEQWVTFDDGFYDETRGRCPLGHEQSLDD